MPSSATVRANGESLRGYLAIFRGALVLTATLTADAVDRSEILLSISITAGSIGDVQRGYRCQFFSSGGAFKGESHIRWSGTLDSTHLPVREFSRSEFLLQAGDVVKVFALTAFADKLTEDDLLFNPDGKPVGTLNSAAPPLACSGGYDARLVDGFGTGTAQTYATIPTDGSQSRTLDPTSNPANLSHLWTRPSGVALEPGSLDTDESPVFRVNVGEYTVFHDVTDDDNGQTWRQCVTYQVFNAASMPIPCEMESPPQGDLDQGGWSCSLRTLVPLSVEDAPDGSPALFFVHERINGSWQSLGASSIRAHVKVAGYLNSDEMDLIAERSRLSFELVSPLDRLSRLPGFSKLFIDRASPDDWTEMVDLDTLTAQIELLRMYTWALDGGHDLRVSALYHAYRYPELGIPKESPRAMVSDLADSADAWFVCDRTGTFRINPQPPLLNAADRAALTIAYTFDRRDILRLVARREHGDAVETLELQAIAATGDGSIEQATAVFSRAPASPGHGAEFITIERIIADPTDAQSDANARAGRRYGMRNGVYTHPTTGAKARAPEIDLELRQVYDFLDFDDQIVRFASFPNPRDVDLTLLDWYFVRARLDYTSGRIISTFRALTDSPPGTTYVPDDSSSAPDDGQQPPWEPPYTYPQPFPGLRAGLQTIYGLNTDNSIYLTTDFLPSVSPAWIVYDTPAWVGDVEDGVQSAFVPSRIVVVTTERIYTYDTRTRTATSRFTFPAATGTPGTRRVIEASFGSRYMVVVSQYFNTAGHEGTWVTYSIDEGISWAAEQQVSGHYSHAGATEPGGIAVSSHGANVALLSAFTVTGTHNTAEAKFFRLTNAAVSAALSTPAGFEPGDAPSGLHIPFESNPSDLIVYFCDIDYFSPPNAHYLTYRKNADGSIDDISPEKAGSTMGFVSQHRALHTCPINRQRVVMWGTDQANHSGVFVSEDAGDTWTDITAGDASSPYLRPEIAGNDCDVIYCIGESGAIGYTDDFGATGIQDKSGNLAVLNPGIGAFKRIWGA